MGVSSPSCHGVGHSGFKGAQSFRLYKYRFQAEQILTLNFLDFEAFIYFLSLPIMDDVMIVNG